MNEAENESAALLYEIGSIEKYLAAAEDVLKAGHMPDMTGLEQRVGALCSDIQKAAHDAQQKCLPPLQALLPRLNNCEAGLRKWKEKEAE
jgi:hypothetical protein